MLLVWELAEGVRPDANGLKAEALENGVRGGLVIRCAKAEVTDMTYLGIHPVTAAYRSGAEPALCFYGRSLERR